MSDTEKLLIRVWEDTQVRGLTRMMCHHEETDYLIQTTINYARSYKEGDGGVNV